MSDVSLVRSIVQDIPLYATEPVTLSPEQLTFQLIYYPVQEGTVFLTAEADLPDFTVDEDSGVITFDTAPVAAQDELVITAEYKHTLLTDQAIADFREIEGADADVRLLAACALDAIATSQALIQKKIKMLDLQTDGPALADALRKHATQLRVMVGTAEESDFDIIEMVYDSFGYGEKILKDYDREG